MDKVRASERRSGRDRRTNGTVQYTGPERRVLKHRRSGFDRRKGWPTVCVYCGTVCGTNKGWLQEATTIETTVEPPYLVIDGRRMIPDFEALVKSGYEYLPVGGALLSPAEEGKTATNGRVSTPLTAESETIV